MARSPLSITQIQSHSSMLTLLWSLMTLFKESSMSPTILFDLLNIITTKKTMIFKEPSMNNLHKTQFKRNMQSLYFLISTFLWIFQDKETSMKIVLQKMFLLNNFYPTLLGMRIISEVPNHLTSTRKKWTLEILEKMVMETSSSRLSKPMSLHLSVKKFNGFTNDWES